MDSMTDGPPLDRTLDPAGFYSLYRGALAAESLERRLQRCYVVLLAGRLGLRPGEILHCHEGWIDWGRGEITVPALDPCACAECWSGARARQVTGDERSIPEILRSDQWSPGSTAGTRTVAFGWSERITAVLASVFDYIEVLDCDRGELAAIVTEAAEAAEGIDPHGLTPSVLRATGGRFLGEVGFDATSVQRILGLPEREPAEAYVAAGGQRPSAATYRAFDRAAVGPDVPPADPARKFPVACDPAPFSREPFTPTDWGVEGRRERAEQSTGRQVRNPREPVVPEGIEYDPGAHRLSGQADDDGGQFSTTAGSEVPNVAALDDWIDRRDASLRAESSRADADSGVPPGMDPDTGGPVEAGAGPPPEPDPSGADDHGAGGGRPVAADGATVGTESAAGGAGSAAGGAGSAAGGSDGPDAPSPGAASPSTTGTAAAGAGGGGGAPGHGFGSGPPETVTDVVTEPIVASVGTRFAAPGVAGGQPVEGRVVLGQEELLLVTPGSVDTLAGPDVEYATVDLDGVVDVVPDAGPDGVGMDSTLGVVRRGADGHDLVAIALEGRRKWDFWMALFRNALHVSQMQVTHPARVGGRVTDESATPGMLYLDRERVRLTPIGSDSTLVSIALADVLHVERTRQDVGGDRQPALAIQQFVDGEAVTSLVGSNSVRTLALFERFVRRDYRERLASARSLSIPDPEKEVLVALYSAGDRVDLTSVFRRDDARLEEIVAALESKGLVTAEALAETELTAKGRLVVSDRLEAVNA